LVVSGSQMWNGSFVSLGKEGWTRGGIRGIAHYLRMFFRYGEQLEWTTPRIADAIRGPRVYQHEQLPLGPSWADVQRLLASTETNRKADIRDRPILLLLVVYGSRVGEVQRIRLEDINWEQKTISITATKQRRCARICPLIPSVADAIARFNSDSLCFGFSMATWSKKEFVQRIQ
jgi:integrase/recombinase XerD